MKSLSQRKSSVINIKMSVILGSLTARFQLISQKRRKTNLIVNISRKKPWLTLVVIRQSIIKLKHLKQNKY